MIDQVYATGDQLRWSAAVGLPEVPAAEHVVLAGMGGSAMAADVGSLTVPHAPTLVHRGYGLPPQAHSGEALLVAVSYSGNTEETMSAVAAAIDAGIPYVAVTTGGELAERAAESGAPLVPIPAGLQPRAALGYQTGVVARVLDLAFGADGDVTAALEGAADVVDRLLGGGKGPGALLGRDLADGLYGRVTVINGGRGVGATAARRWKTQINENAKMPAFASEVPEVNHNELEGWGTLRDLGERMVGVIMLRDPGGHPRQETRMSLSTEVLAGKVEVVGDVVSQGETPLDRFFSLAVVGDVASVHLAKIAGVDATPVGVLEDFKRRLREA